MEDTLIAAYTALLTGYCIMEDEVNTSGFGLIPSYFEIAQFEHKIC